MIITNKECVDMINALGSLENKVLPRKLAFAVAKNLTLLESQIYKPYSKELEKINKAHAVLDENENQKADEHGRLIYKGRDQYQEELLELCEIENEIELHTVSEELLDLCDKEEKYDSLTLRETRALIKMLE